MAAIKHISLSGFKSIREMSLDLGRMNVLIGPNGGGKSNLLSLFQLLREISNGSLQTYVAKSGGADRFLFGGAKITQSVQASVDIETSAGPCTYEFVLELSAGDSLVLGEERVLAPGDSRDDKHLYSDPQPHRESRFDPDTELLREVWSMMQSGRVHHFHDTSWTAAPRRHVYLEDNRALHGDAGNLAAFLYRLKVVKPAVYRRIVQVIQQSAPWFGEFVLQPSELNPVNILLNWHEAGSDTTCGPHLISDGTLRMMALVTLLLQPEEELPPLLVVDEPELGLHPMAVNGVASLLNGVSHAVQVVVALQSVAMLDYFDPEDIVVADRDGPQSIFQRLNAVQLADWLDRYTLGELWEKNVLGGSPA
jgi:predicted ATPase